MLFFSTTEKKIVIKVLLNYWISIFFPDGQVSAETYCTQYSEDSYKSTGMFPWVSTFEPREQHSLHIKCSLHAFECLHELLLSLQKKGPK